MPKLAFFTNAVQLEALFRILKAHAALNEKTGYCQGMGFVAAVFLYYLTELDAFYCFQKYMERHGGLYQSDMKETRVKCNLLMEML